MIKYFEDKKRLKTPQYAIFQADEEDTVVTLYESGKAVFQGISADIDADMWKEMEKHLNPNATFEEPKPKDNKDNKNEFVESKIYHTNTIGSDEVGTGDYFGPIVVTSAYVNKENISFLAELGVKDSKKLEDNKILEIVPEIIKKIPYSSIVLSNTEYNNMYSKDVNMNKIKAVLHNKVLLELTSKDYPTDYVVVDEFAKQFVYYNYLKGLPNVYRKITFMTKAEDKVLSVACASLISRFIFIKEMDKLSDSLGIVIPKGSGEFVDMVGKDIVSKFGFDKLNEIAKMNFKNTEKIKNV
jgi:ribonuclease HIII